MKLINVLTEATGRKYEYGCAMLYFDFPQINEIHDLIESDDIYTEEGDTTFGLEKEPHTTLLFGLHDGVTTDDISKVLTGFKYGNCNIKNASLFENEKYDVLKFDVDGDNLHETNGKLRKFPHTNSYPDYHPHMTIAYIKPGMGKKYVDLLKGKSFQLLPQHAVYSKPDGSQDTIKIRVK
jgi:hypothetical protein